MNRIYIIDEQIEDREYLTKRIEKNEKSIVKSFYDEYKAMLEIEREQPEIVIIDISSVMQWEKMANRIFLNSKNINIFLISNGRSFDDVMNGIKMGVGFIIIKPFEENNIKELLSIIEKYDEGNLTRKNTMIGGDLINRTLSYINENYHKPITLKKVSEELNVSNWHMCKIIRSERDTTFINLLNNIRIEKAKELLRNTDLPINEIAAKVGIAEFTYFSNLFKKQTGITAGGYRKQLKIIVQQNKEIVPQII